MPPRLVQESRDVAHCRNRLAMMWSTAARRCFSVYNIRIKFIIEWSTISCAKSDRHTDIRTEERTHARTDGGTNGRHGRTDAQTDRRHGHHLIMLTYGPRNGRTDERTERRTERRTDVWTDGTHIISDRYMYILTRRARGTHRC